jgi:hypothetical protein
MVNAATPTSDGVLFVLFQWSIREGMAKVFGPQIFLRNNCEKNQGISPHYAFNRKY